MVWTGRGKGGARPRKRGTKLRRKWGEAEKRGVKQEKKGGDGEKRRSGRKARRKMEAMGRGAVRRPSRAKRGGEAAGGQRKGERPGQTRG